MTSRRDARRHAIDILYQSDVTDADPTVVLAEWIDAGRLLSPFTAELVDGVDEHLPEIDLLLEEHSEGWTVSRMAALDRTILRVAVHELCHRPDIPPSVAISEAVEAATDLSAEGAPRFVNGILGKIASELRPAAAEDPGRG
ncbi:MAG TPA: transcription antitermination factor NusB [Actinomycetota bacterium]|nr:transcription antitermination factor NusB [Actinomycetota bacterium]